MTQHLLKLLTGAAILTASSASATTLYYEPFDYAAGDLSTVSGGVWSDSGSAVGAGSLSVGGLSGVGNKVEGMSNDTSWTTTLGAITGQLDDGDTLWFSVMFNAENIGTNPDFGFALATDRGQDSNNVPLANSGDGYGFRVKGNNGGLNATSWSGGGATNGTSQGIAEETTHLIVGEMIFNSNPASNDTINLYLPDATLNLGSAVATRSAALDQTTFDTITFMNKGANDDDVDEIRFGTSYFGVIPEPSTSMLLGLAGLGILLRRQR